MRSGNNDGFTLIELIISMAILGIIFALVFSYFTYNAKIYTMANYEANIQFDCTMVMETVTVAVKESAEISETIDLSGVNSYEFRKTTGGNVFMRVEFNTDTAELVISRFNPESSADPPTSVADYKYIDDFKINAVDDADESLREIIVVGRRKDEIKRFNTTVSMRN